MAFTTLQKPRQMVDQTIELPDNIITEMSKNDFNNALHSNPGILIIKFGAEWCGPCKKIEPLVNRWFSQFPNTVQSAIIDIDDNFELYAFLKSKKQVNGIPVILCYKKGNTTWIPDDVIVGADEIGINRFFEKCMTYV
jgi:thioredoxin 1